MKGVGELAGRIGQLLDRYYGISFSRLLSMGKELLLRMQELYEKSRRSGKTDAPDIRERWDALLDGHAPRDADEDMVVKQMQQNRRLIERLVPLDSRINQSLAGRK